MIKAFDHTAPENWNEIIGYAGQAVEYATAMKKLGYKPYYCKNGTDTALIQIRGHDYPVIKRLTSRGYVYPFSSSKDFIGDIIEKLRSVDIPFARIGNNNWGVRDRELLESSNFRIIPRHTFIIDLSRDEEEIWKNFNKKTRNAIRKAEKENVIVKELFDKKLLSQWYNPYLIVSKRVRDFHAYTIFPVSVFETFFDSSRKSAYARFFAAEWQGKTLAGDMVICFRDTMLAYQGGMLREYSTKQAPSALVWHCIKLAKEEGFKFYDMGGCTPGLDESDSRYSVYAFKKRFGGELIEFYNAEIILDERIANLQNRYVLKVWNKMHPYLGR